MFVRLDVRKNEFFRNLLENDPSHIPSTHHLSSETDGLIPRKDT